MTKNLSHCGQRRGRVNQNGPTLDEVIQTGKWNIMQEYLTVLRMHRERCNTLALAAQLLAAEGFDVKPFQCRNSRYAEIDLEIEQKDLPRVHKALGRLRPRWTDVKDAKKRLVNVSLKAVNFPDVTIRYVKKLPRNSRCKIKLVRERGSKSHQLVCA